MIQEAIDRLNDLRRRCDELAQEPGAMSEIECISNEIKNVVEMLGCCDVCDENGEIIESPAERASYTDAQWAWILRNA